MPKRLTKPVRISFTAQAGDKVMLSPRRKMTKPVVLSKPSKTP